MIEAKPRLLEIEGFRFDEDGEAGLRAKATYNAQRELPVGTYL